MHIQLKRAYDKPKKTDGKRILVDGLWPRGIKKDQASITLWLKDITPSKELRTWFGHDPDKWPEFKRRYFKELKQHRESVKQVTELAEHGKITLVYGAKDEEHNNAVALKDYLEKH
jgi:uncharacterized protein YeaO (DUF488 family)